MQSNARDQSSTMLAIQKIIEEAPKEHLDGLLDEVEACIIDRHEAIQMAEFTEKRKHNTVALSEVVHIRSPQPDLENVCISESLAANLRTWQQENKCTVSLMTAPMCDAVGIRMFRVLKCPHRQIMILAAKWPMGIDDIDIATPRMQEIVDLACASIKVWTPPSYGATTTPPYYGAATVVNDVWVHAESYPYDFFIITALEDGIKKLAIGNDIERARIDLHSNKVGGAPPTSAAIKQPTVLNGEEDTRAPRKRSNILTGLESRSEWKMTEDEKHTQGRSVGRHTLRVKKY